MMLWGNENKHKENNSVAQLERGSRRPDAATASLFTDAARERLENANQTEKADKTRLTLSRVLVNSSTSIVTVFESFLGILNRGAGCGARNGYASWREKRVAKGGKGSKPKNKTEGEPFGGFWRVWGEGGGEKGEEFFRKVAR